MKCDIKGCKNKAEVFLEYWNLCQTHYLEIEYVGGKG